jgi:hypothetical protein
VKWVLRVLREPLLHFLALATVLFVLSGFWCNALEDNAGETIVVSEAKVRSLALMFHRTWQRPPTREELDGLIEDHVDEEVFYREALKMGLDRNDTAIRRRLRTKLEFVAEDLADAVEPTDEQLQQLLDEHEDRFRVERRATFTQIYLSRDRRGDSLEGDARQLLERLRSESESVDVAELGDPFLLPSHHEDLREAEITSLFGPQFAVQLLTVEPGRWSGPIESGYGVHLVLVQERREGRVPELAEIRDAVSREWYAARRAASKEDFYRSLRERYEVIVKMPEEVKSGRKAEDN